MSNTNTQTRNSKATTRLLITFYGLMGAILSIPIANIITNKISGDGNVPEPEKKEVPYERWGSKPNDGIYKSNRVYPLSDSNTPNLNISPDLVKIDAASVVLARYNKNNNSERTRKIPIQSFNDAFKMATEYAVGDKRQYYAFIYDEKGESLAEIRCTGRADCVLQPHVNLKPKP